ncbi:MAG TPA: hypothetical protein VFW87_02250, partial [Pirellulales bacterium]|nr:hypothetical protein [Pirellulales bacterium]
ADKAAAQANALAIAEKQLTDEEVAKLNAQGIFTPQQQQQMAQQAQQQMQQLVQPLLQQLQQQVGATAQGAAAAGASGFNGEAAQGVIDAAKQAKTPQEALQILKGYYQAQAGMTLLNIKNVAATNDPIMGSFGGQYQGANNLQYVLSQGGPAVETYKQLLAMIDAIDAKLKTMPHMASGGIVTSPTTALIGEAGPEAVIPLPILQRLFGNPAGIFPGAGGNVNNFAIDPGGFGINPLGLSMGNLGWFGRMFGSASSILSRQADLGNLGSLGILGRWSGVQQTLEDALGFMYQHRRINLQPGSRYSPMRDLFGDVPGGPLGRAINPGAYGHQFNLTMNVDQALQREHISQAFDWFEEEARKRGADGIGRSRLRSGPSGQMMRGPLTPAGVAH